MGKIKNVIKFFTSMFQNPPYSKMLLLKQTKHFDVAFAQNSIDKQQFLKAKLSQFISLLSGHVVFLRHLIQQKLVVGS